MKITGIIPPMVTPFCADETIDFEQLKREVHRLRAAGVDGLSFAGSTGEGAVLSDEELHQGIRVVKAESGHDVPVICGIIRNATRQGISAALAAKAAGADALMVTPTGYFGTDTAGNLSYYRDIYAATRLPIIIYNVISSNRIEAKDMPLFLTVEGIIGIKQSLGGVHAVADMVRACGRERVVYAAQDDVMFLSFLCGARGAISAILTLFPDLFVAQWQAIQTGDVAKARGIHDRVLPVWREIEGTAFPGRMKTALELLGIPVGDARRPILRTNAAVRDNIQKALIESGFLA